MGKIIPTTETTDKGLISKTFKQFMQLNIKKQTTQSTNGQTTLTDISPKKIYRFPADTMKRCSSLTIIREMQIKTTVSITSRWSE